jgi:hypothetical protein
MEMTTDYMADWREAQSQGHHPDCDGYMTSHRVTLVRKRYDNGSYSWTPTCEECGKLFVGSFGQEQDAKNVSAGHSSEVACDKRCLAWDNEEAAATLEP